MQATKIIPLLLSAALTGGCAKAVLKTDHDPNVDLTTIETVMVKKLPADGRGVNQIIANKLDEFGFDIIAEGAAPPPQGLDAIVIYKDRWMWDITMYMLDIEIKFLDPNTDFVFASGKSYRTSLVRKPPEVMVDEVLRDLFSEYKNLPPTPNKESNDDE